MRTLGIILIILGIVMMVFSSFNFQTEKKVVDVGPLQVDKKENHRIGWPVYAGGIVLVAGIVVFTSAQKKN